MTTQWRTCPHFGDCGGCAYQDIPYEEQLAKKHEVVRAALSDRLSATDIIESPVVPGPPIRYRNKMEFTFDPCGRPGLHRKGEFRSIVPIETCQLCTREMEEVLRRVATWSHQWGLEGYDKRSRRGLLRHLALRTAGDGTLLVSLFTAREPASDLERAAIESLPSLLDDLALGGLLWIVNPDRADAAKVDAARTRLLRGTPFILDRLHGFAFRIGVDTFFQINLAGARVLIDLVRQFCDAPAATGPIFDLFSGVGTFSLPIARDFPDISVVGIELGEDAVSSARQNAQDNGLDNVFFVQMDARRGIPEAISQFGVPEIVILDPPRSGAGGKVMRKIGRTDATRVIYVSCNPASLAVDVEELEAFGYAPRRVVPVDMFPQTPHVETVVLLTQTSSA